MSRVIAIVSFGLPRKQTLDQATATFQATAPKYLNLPGLLRKNYFLSGDGMRAGGIYLWESREAAERVYSPEWKAFVKGKYGNDPEIVYVDTPVMVHNLLQSIRLLADGMNGFDRHCAQGLEPRRERIAELLQDSLMLVTALNPHIGYDAAAQIARNAHAHGLKLRDAALASGKLTGEQFDAWVRAADMVRPG